MKNKSVLPLKTYYCGCLWVRKTKLSEFEQNAETDSSANWGCVWEVRREKVYPTQPRIQSLICSKQLTRLPASTAPIKLPANRTYLFFKYVFLLFNKKRPESQEKGGGKRILLSHPTAPDTHPPFDCETLQMPVTTAVYCCTATRINTLKCIAEDVSRNGEQTNKWQRGNQQINDVICDGNSSIN